MIQEESKGIACLAYAAGELRVKFPELQKARDATILLLFDAALRRFTDNLKKTLWSFGVSRVCISDDGNEEGARKTAVYRVEGGWGMAQIEVTYANIDPGRGEMWFMAEKAVFTGDARGARMLFSAFNGVCRSSNFSGLRRVIEE